MATVGSHQQAPLTLPVNGTSPIDADEVRLNDNAVGASHNAHDNDATLHVQSSVLVLRPAPAEAGRLWFTTDERKLYYDTSTAWQELKLTATNVDGGTLSTAVLPVVPVAKGGTGVSSTPANGYILIGNGTGFSLAQISAGSNMVVTNGPGSITLEATLAGGAISGSGTSGYVPRFTASTTIGAGVIRDNGSYVGINTAPDSNYRLSVGGALGATSVDTTTLTADVVDAGDLAINGVDYTWPSSDGAAFAQLQTNGAGTLSWAPSAKPTLYFQQTYGGF